MSDLSHSAIEVVKRGQTRVGRGGASTEELRLMRGELIDR